MLPTSLPSKPRSARTSTSAQLVVFSAAGVATSVLMTRDLEAFTPHAVISLIDYFPSRLSKRDFWPDRFQD
jgi:hypothetical protein